MSSDELIEEISDIFHIGKNARTSEIILTNIKNAIRRSDCLYEIEKYHTIVSQENGEKFEESKLNWGEEPKEYIKTYKQILNESNRLQQNFPSVLVLREQYKKETGKDAVHEHYTKEHKKKTFYNYAYGVYLEKKLVKP